MYNEEILPCTQPFPGLARATSQLLENHLCSGERDRPVRGSRLWGADKAAAAYDIE